MDDILIPFHDYNVKCNGVEDINVSEIIQSPLFINWLNSLDSSLHLKNVFFQYCEKDPKLNQYTFIKASTLCIRNGGKIPRFVILQGKMVSILLKLQEIENSNKSYIVLSENPFVVTGKSLNTSFQLHIGTNTFTIENVKKYLLDLIGISIPIENIRNLSEETGKNELFPLPGNSDANITVFIANISLPYQKIMELEGKSDLLGSQLIFHVFPESETIRHSHDYATIASYSIYRHIDQ